MTKFKFILVFPLIVLSATTSSIQPSYSQNDQVPSRTKRVVGYAACVGKALLPNRAIALDAWVWGKWSGAALSTGVAGTLIAVWVLSAYRGYNASINCSSPLVLDLDGDGIELSSLKKAEDVVFFDLDIDGFAEATGFAIGGDGLLALDRNGNGIIDHSAELFGDKTGFKNGFLALAAYDQDADGRITPKDEILTVFLYGLKLRMMDGAKHLNFFHLPNWILSS